MLEHRGLSDMQVDDTWEVAGMNLRSRVILGTARYPSRQVMFDALEASGTQMVTVSLRRVPLVGGETDVYQELTRRGWTILPNTAGCYTAKDAILTAELAREALQTNLIKVEVIADDKTLLPDVVELLNAARELVRLGFQVLPYTNDDPVTARKLADLGCAAVMPLAAPIGSGLGLRNPHNLELIVAHVRVPTIVDAGLGTASDVAMAFEIGCDAVLLNTAVARARNPVRMARAMRYAAEAGRDAYGAGRIPKKRYAECSSPMDGRLQAHVRASGDLST